MTYEEIEAAIMCRIENLLAQEETDSYYEEKNARALESYLRALQIIKNIEDFQLLIVRLGHRLPLSVLVMYPHYSIAFWICQALFWDFYKKVF